MTQFIKEEINNHIDSATTNMQDLLTIYVHSIPMQMIRDFCKKTIVDNHDDNNINIKSIHWKIISIERILPKDIIQYILSFHLLDLQSIKCVSRQWNLLAKQNEKLHYIKLLKKEDQSFIPYDEEQNTTYIIRHPKSILTSVEKDMGFKKFPTNNNTDDSTITFHISNYLNGDRFIIFPGSYECIKQFNLQKDLSIIGIPSIGKRFPVIFWKIPVTTNGAIQIHGCKLSIKKCKIQCMNSIITVNKNASLQITNSAIYSGGPRHSAIRVEENARKIIINKNVINDHKHCIEFNINSNEQITTQVICKNNIFNNIASYCIVRKENNNNHDYDNNDEYKLYGKLNKKLGQIANNKRLATFSFQKQIKHKHNQIYIKK